MDRHPHRNQPPVRDAAPVAPRTLQPRVPPDRVQWTPALQRIFLAALAESGSVARAARAAGMSRSGAHRLRRRLAGTPFDRLWDHALALHARRMADPFAHDGAPAARPAASPERA
ncbi:LysR family transcriptional regulator [Sphingomonas cannabina]|uniref:LysR family transcriptional regulator n=1 Tax=Sphingomonas cannabina TaxID=2899123 RepID=UPI001F28E342|nr:LysR family transcriptional regulator [Sphingomonas cannabina]UIJ45665.1 LysR family transcriptional regulator [Sphingomonas cannabina]